MVYKFFYIIFVYQIKTSKEMTNIVKTTIHLSKLNIGDTVEYKNELLTVSKKDINRCSFFGYSFRGDASKQTITKIQFAVPTNKGIVYR